MTLARKVGLNLSFYVRDMYLNTSRAVPNIAVDLIVSIVVAPWG